MTEPANVDVFILSLRGCVSVCFSLHNEDRAISSVLLFFHVAPLLTPMELSRTGPFKPKILLGIVRSDLAPSPSFGPIRLFFHSHYLLLFFLFFYFIHIRACRLLICSMLQLHSGLRFARGEGEDNGKQSEHVGRSAKVLMRGRRKTALRSNL